MQLIGKCLIINDGVCVLERVAAIVLCLELAAK